MPAPRFTMVVLLIEDLPRSLAFYRRLGVEFPPDAEQRTDIQVPIGDSHQMVLTTGFVTNDPDRQPPRQIPAAVKIRIPKERCKERFKDQRGRLCCRPDRHTKGDRPET